MWKLVTRQNVTCYIFILKEMPLIFVLIFDWGKCLLKMVHIPSKFMRANGSCLFFCITDSFIAFYYFDFSDLGYDFFGEALAMKILKIWGYDR